MRDPDYRSLYNRVPGTYLITYICGITGATLAVVGGGGPTLGLGGPGGLGFFATSAKAFKESPLDVIGGLARADKPDAGGMDVVNGAGVTSFAIGCSRASIDLGFEAGRGWLTGTAEAEPFSGALCGGDCNGAAAGGIAGLAGVGPGFSAGAGALIVL